MFLQFNFLLVRFIAHHADHDAMFTGGQVDQLKVPRFVCDRTNSCSSECHVGKGYMLSIAGYMPDNIGIAFMPLGHAEWGDTKKEDDNQDM